MTATTGRPRPNANTERMPRLLALVPYLQARPGISVAQASRDFGVTEDQLRRDLTLLWMCGLPGHGPGDLIDLSFEGESVSVVFDAGMSRPLRLTPEEALALVVALRTLAETPGLADTDAVQRALAKIESVAGEGVHDETVAVELDEAERWLALAQHAVDEQRAIRIRYYSASRNETTDRIVDPLRVFVSDRRNYLEGWCRQAEGMRVFRVDRLDDVVLLDEPAVLPAEVQQRDLSEGVFRPAAEHLLVTLRLAPVYAWIADYYPTESVAAVGDDLLVGLRVADPAWVRSLVFAAAGQARVVEPQWLADEIRAQADLALRAYGAAAG